MRPRQQLPGKYVALRTGALDGKVVSSGKMRMSLFAGNSARHVKGKRPGSKTRDPKTNAGRTLPLPCQRVAAVEPPASILGKGS